MRTMDNVYFSTFITGLQEVVETALKEELKDVGVVLLLDGLVVYRTSKSFQEIKNLRFFNNSFLLFRFFENIKEPSLELMMESLLKDPRSTGKLSPGLPQYQSRTVWCRTVRGFASETQKKPRALARGGSLLNKFSFRVITSKENQLISVNKQLLEQVEHLFTTRWHLRVDRSQPDIEVWFLWRNEGYGFAGLRLTRTPNYEKTLYKGELRPELANIMCLISEPSSNDVFLDPFAGYGAIPIERAKAFPYAQIMAGEKELPAFKVLEDKVKKTRQKIVVGKWDALNLSALTDNSLDKIVTDPPWGIFSHQGIDLDDFYTKMLKEFVRVLKPGGLIVVLMGQKDLFEQVLSQFHQLRLLKKYDILVSGKKASVYKIWQEIRLGRNE